MSDASRQALVIEDDRDLAQAVADLLGDAGFAVTLRHDGESGFLEGRSGSYDVIVLDLMLPKRNGFSVCLDLREAGVATPLLILTAKEGDLDEVEGFEVGADDFLRKPFEPLILLARVQALLRRRDRERPQPLVVGGLALDPLTRRVTVEGRDVTLTPREFALLEYLLGHAGPVAKVDILSAVWGGDFDGDPNIVEVYIGYLRRKLDEDGEPSFIRTVRGVGYRIREA